MVLDVELCLAVPAGPQVVPLVSFYRTMAAAGEGATLAVVVVPAVVEKDMLLLAVAAPRM